MSAPEQNSGEPLAVTIPVVLWLGHTRILGEAAVSPDSVTTYFASPESGLPETRHSREASEHILRLIQQGVVTRMSIDLNPPPATPALNQETGQVEWNKNY